MNMWEASSPPAEEWGDNDDAEYGIRGIVGEEVDDFDERRFEIKWEDWHRADGTNTTWEHCGPDSDMTKIELRKKWDRRQEDKRIALASDTLVMRFAPYPTQLWHEDRTAEIAEGYHEKKREAERRGEQRFEDWDRLPRLGDHGPDDERSTSGRRSDRRNLSVPALSELPRTSIAPQRYSQVNMNATCPAPASPRSSSTHIRRSNQGPPAERSPGLGSSGGTSVPSKRKRSASQRIIRIDSESEPELEDTRQALQKKWSVAARAFGAERITFVNEVNTESVPPLAKDFTYCEHHYIRAANVPKLEDTMGCLVKCECDTGCEGATACDCQEPSELVDDFGDKEFAYTRNRLFKFILPPGTEVIECNEHCGCIPGVCPNRVAQLPRDVPIEIFRTQNRGWGVRATRTVERGKVLGILTGLLVRRTDLQELTEEHKTFIFDLDVHESGEDDEDDTDKFSVDCWSSGNWTRFVNHSCEPNARVYPVVWDTVPEMNQPYLAFVAMERIPARTELTIDYSPSRKKSKGKAKIPRGAEKCFCGARECRGWV